MSTLEIKLLDPRAKMPRRETEGAAGFDLACIEPVAVEPWVRAVVRTGLAMKLPPGTYGRIASRSGPSFAEGIEVGAGVVDEDYRGEVLVHLYHNGHAKQKDAIGHSQVARAVFIEAGTYIAQMVITPYVAPQLEVVEALDETLRKE